MSPSSWFPVAVGVVFGVLSGSMGAQIVRGPIADPDSYAVYGAVIRSMVKQSISHVVIYQDTDPYRECLPTGAPLENEWRDAFEAFKASNTARRSLVAGFSMGIPYTLISPAQAMKDPINARDFPEGFDKLYPKSGSTIFGVSAVGFNSERTKAIVAVGHHCGFLCGGGTSFFLRKARGRWNVTVPDGINRCVWQS